MNDFTVTVVEYPATRLIGLKVRTSMQKAETDCMAVWETFGPRMGELLGDGGGRGSYGVSVMLNAEEFEYWAAVPTAPSAAVPAGMAGFDLPAGLFAKTTAASLEALKEAYMFLYETWAKSQKEYAVDYQGPCFELYPPNFQMTDSFEVFMPVRKA